MAPYPEEIDVFSAPHSRMKQLVDVYSEKLTCTDFTDYISLESLLHDLHNTFCEFKSHEQIENKYIMRKLKKRLKSLSIHDAAVCNCHSDNKLSDILALVEDGYSCTSKPEADRINFGIKLQNALKNFTASFLPHMKEEEEVFQPMLMKYFGYEELKCLKEQVLEEHSKWQNELEKYAFEKAEVKTKAEPTEKYLDCHISSLPPEIMSYVFSFLSPLDILRCSEVCHQWYDISHEPSLWKEIYPCFWAHGIWNDYDENHEDCIERFYSSSLNNERKYYDEDADIDEYEEEADGSSDCYSAEYTNGPNQRELHVLQSIVLYLLPHIGIGVQKIVIGSCRSLTSNLLRSILILCPNIVFLDISYTGVLDSAFKGLKESLSCVHLQHLDMSGCKNITDLGLFRLADAMALMPPHVPNASDELREVYLEDCHRSFTGGGSADCLCDLEESGLWLQRSNPCFQCRADQFCSSVCFWQKNGVMCHLAKLSLQCPFVNSCEQFETSNFFAAGASSILKTTGTFVSDSSVSQISQSEACDSTLMSDSSLNQMSQSEVCDRKSIKYLNLSGCKEITDEGLSCLLEAGVLQGLEYLDVSGCSFLTGSGLCAITDSLNHLKPENIFYCDQITDGPYPETANGCQNLESNSRACCCRMAS